MLTPKFRISAFFTVLVLALGIGLATTVYSLVHGVLLRSLDYPHADRLAYVWSPNPHIDSAPKELPPANATYYQWQQQAQSFEHLAMFEQTSMRLANQERIGVVKVSGNFFATLGVGAELGRTIGTGEDRPGGEAVAVISRSLWQRQFGGAPDAVGRILRLDKGQFRVIGVMHQGFAFPQTWELPPTIRDRDSYDVWIPLAHTLKERMDQGFVFGIGEGSVIGRLRAGVDPQKAQTEMDGIMAQIARTKQGPAADSKALVNPLLDAAFGDVRSEMGLLLGAVAVVLLLTCANVANLLLARFGARKREMAVRTALGATRGRLVRMLLAESLSLSLLGGLLGTLLAYWAIRVLIQLAPEGMPRVADVSIDSQVLLFALTASLVTGLLCGVAGALPVASNSGLLQVRAPILTHGRLRNTLMAVEVAFSLVLLTTAGLLIRSYLNVAAETTGYSSAVLTVQATLPDGYDTQRQTAAFRRILAALDARPEIAGVAANNYIPLGGGGSIGTLDEVEGFPKQKKGLSTHQRTITPGYFRAMGIPLVDGREFSESDYGAKTTYVVVSAKFARQYFGDGHRAVGKGIRQVSDGSWQRIIGVVSDVKTNTLEQQPLGEIYRMLDKEPQSAMYLAIRPRNSMSPGSLVRTVVQASEPGVALGEFLTMQDRIWSAGAARRFHTSVVSSFASLSLLLGMVGLFGLSMHWVRTRTSEVGLRMALGASRTEIFSLVLRQGLRPLIAGVAVGMALSWVATKAMAGFVYGIPPNDPFTLIAAPGLLLFSGVLAYLVPCIRATRVDPAISLRTELPE